MTPQPPNPPNSGTGCVVWNRNQVVPKDLWPISPLGDGRCLAGSTLLLGEDGIQGGTKPFRNHPLCFCGGRLSHGYMRLRQDVHRFHHLPIRRLNRFMVRLV